jgi:aminoglycoside phosphotransferase
MSKRTHKIGRIEAIASEGIYFMDRALKHIAELEKDKARLDWLLRALMEPGQILQQMGWADGRKAIDAAMAEQRERRQK